MARVPESEIERLKEEVSVERLAEAHGVELKQHGKDLIGLCPFHDDKEPSLVITPQKNLWNCLGACNAGGTVIDWVMKAESVSFRHAVEVLREQGGVGTLVGAVRGSAGEEQPLVEPSESDAVLLAKVVGYYAGTLKATTEGQAYLEKRGLMHPELIETFRLGYANRTLGYRLPPKQLKAGAEVRSRLEGLGVFRKSGHEHFSGSLVVPIFGADGSVTELYGRKVTPNLRKGTPLHLYLPGPHRGVFNRKAVMASEEVILCESLIDAMTFWCAGFRNVTASYGATGFTGDHFDLFRESGVKRVLIAYDRDPAGDATADKLGELLAKDGIESFRVLFPKGMDANEYALKVTPKEQSLGVALRNAEWMRGGERTQTAKAPASAVATVATAATPAPTCAAPDESKEPARDGQAAQDASVIPSLVAERGPKAERSVAGASPATQAAKPAAEPAAAPEALWGETRGALPKDGASVSTDAPEQDEIVMQQGDRRWRVRGLSKNTSPGVLRVNLFVSRAVAAEGSRASGVGSTSGAGGFHVDSLELYSARQRQSFIEVAGRELGCEERVIKKDLGEVLLALEVEQERRMRALTEPKQKTPTLTDAEKKAALDLLKSPKLTERILADFERLGIVGERANKLVGYVAATSRKLERPLAIVVQSSSAAGKSSLMDAILSLMPEEERVEYSAMTGQALFYMGETNLRHKILAIVEEEGAERASYALKLLQSEGKLTIASTGKDPRDGRLVTEEYSVEGPVMLFLTTTAIDVDEELLNRCLVLTVDEGREQTRAIHRLQREAETLRGALLRRERARLRTLHQNAQRLLLPLLVVNPFAEKLTFFDHVTRTRRDHMKYLTLIRSVTLLHQYQRSVRTVTHEGERVEYIEVTKEDIQIADELCLEVLTNTLGELPPKTRELLEELEVLVRERAAERGMDMEDVAFTAREAREYAKIGSTQLKVHLGRLVELEYVELHKAQGRQRYVYRLLGPARPEGVAACEYDGRAGVARDYDSIRSGQSGDTVGPRSAPGRASVGPPNRPVLSKDSHELSNTVGANDKARLGTKKNGAVVVVDEGLASLVAEAAAGALASGAN